MSHELRTPLNSIIGFSDVIAAQKDPKTAEYAQHIGQSGRRLLDVVSDILDISKIESGTFTLNRQPADLGEIIADSVETMLETIAQRRQSIDLRVPRDLPMLEIDQRRIKQVLVNLLSNANKFTSERGRIILIARKNPDGGISVAIADTGAGMSPDQIATALRPFGQVQSHLTRSTEGAGLGLPIARGLARQHGGDLFIQSEPGQGTTVILHLPKRSAP
jgi:two-component system cell cycle sensor histidine kinase PleC